LMYCIYICAFCLVNVWPGECSQCLAIEQFVIVLAFTYLADPTSFDAPHGCVYVHDNVLNI